MQNRYPRNSSFIASPHFSNANRSPGDIDWIVVHDMEMPEKPTTAEACANMFRTSSREASAHWCFDNNSTVQGVDLSDVAWAAPGGNSRGVQLEHAGFASQNPSGWADPFSIAMLKDQSAPLAAWVCQQTGIPARYVSSAGLLAGHRGITTHYQVSLAFRRSTHTDPGKSFPMAKYLEWVQARIAGAQPTLFPVRTTPSRLVTVGGQTFWTYFPRWESISKGQRFWAQTIALQYRLNRNGCALVLDGVFGPGTDAGARYYQRKSGLAPDGVVGSLTARRLSLTG